MYEDGYDSPSRDRNPSPPPELLRDHGDLVHADNVGGSSFSKHWVFSILMKLIKTVDRENDTHAAETAQNRSDLEITTTDGDDKTVECEDNEGGDSGKLATEHSTRELCTRPQGVGQPEGGDDSGSNGDNADVEEICDESLGIDIDDSLQTELCKLWDMSTDQDVCTFLHQYQTLDILTGIIARTKAPRVAEICTGIVANMSCVCDICETLSRDDKIVDMFVMLLDSRDGPTLTEVVRLLHTCLTNSSASSTFLSSLKSAPDTLSNIIFILSSSTNVNLLKNTGELVDTILDRDAAMVDEWGTGELVNGLLEAMQQLRSVGEGLDAYIHILQLLSTSNTGVDALVTHCERTEVSLQKYLDLVCEDEVVGVLGREATLASVLAVFNVLFSSSTDVATNCLESEKFLLCLLKIIEGIEPDKKPYQTSHNVSRKAVRKPSPYPSPHNSNYRGINKVDDSKFVDKCFEIYDSSTRKKDNRSLDAGVDFVTIGSKFTVDGEADTSRGDDASQEQEWHCVGGGGDKCVSGEERSGGSDSGDKRVSAEVKITCVNDSGDKRVSSERSGVSPAPIQSVNDSFLYDVLQGFVADIVALMAVSYNDKENTNTSPHPLLTYLNACRERERVSRFISLLETSGSELVEKIKAEARHHGLGRLIGVMDKRS